MPLLQCQLFEGAIATLIVTKLASNVTKLQYNLDSVGTLEIKPIHSIIYTRPAIANPSADW